MCNQLSVRCFIRPFIYGGHNQTDQQRRTGLRHGGTGYWRSVRPWCQCRYDPWSCHEAWLQRHVWSISGRRFCFKEWRTGASGALWSRREDDNILLSGFRFSDQEALSSGAQVYVYNCFTDDSHRSSDQSHASGCCMRFHRTMYCQEIRSHWFHYFRWCRLCHDLWRTGQHVWGEKYWPWGMYRDHAAGQ